jgi:hypothetical protein
MFAPITPRTKSPSTKREVKQDWEKLYRAAIIESDRSKLLQRCNGSRTQMPRFLSDHDVCQSRQPTARKSRKLSLGPCTF